MTVRHKMYKEFLDAIYEDCTRHGKTTDLVSYAKTYGVNANVCTVLVQLGIVKKHKSSGRIVEYSWCRRQPDETMVLEVVDGLSMYCSNHHKKNNGNINVSNKVLNISLDDVIDALTMLPEKLSRNEKKELAKKLAIWKNS